MLYHPGYGGTSLLYHTNAVAQMMKIVSPNDGLKGDFYPTFRSGSSESVESGGSTNKADWSEPGNILEQPPHTNTSSSLYLYSLSWGSTFYSGILI